MFTQELLENNRQIVSKFLVLKPIPPIYQVIDDKKRYGYIYCIENIDNHKKYIGSTYATYSGIQNPSKYSALKKRCSAYVYEYNHAIRIRKSLNDYMRPILKAMVTDGIDKFIMYPIAETTRENHADSEKYFMGKYDTIRSGYNQTNSIEKSLNNRGLGRKMLASEKRSRSEGIIAVNLNNRKIIFAESMKLFGDYMNSSKDMIKNSVRKGRPYKGWFIFYLNSEKRAYILNEYVLGTKLAPSDRHSESSRNFYKDLYEMVTSYINNYMDCAYFNDFEIETTLEYSDEKSSNK